jgi:Sec-independent protein translocase protein TatA
VFAFLPSLGWQEMFLLLVLGLLLYGRNLPDAGKKLGRFVAQLKRGFQDFKDQMDRDESLREVRKTIQDTTREVRNVTAVPRAIADPTRALRDLTNEAMSAPVTDDSPRPTASDPPQRQPRPRSGSRCCRRRAFPRVPTAIRWSTSSLPAAA